MGAADFFVVIYLSDSDFAPIEELYRSNSMIKKYLPYHTNDADSSMHIEASRACFFPVTNVIYDLCKRINEKNPIVKIKTADTYRAFDFLDELDFFCWMYRIWKKSLDYYFQYRGAFMLSPSECYNYSFFKNRMEKRYFVKLPDCKEK